MEFSEYVKLQYRCEPKEFIEPRIQIVSAVNFLLPKLKEMRISEPVYYDLPNIKDHIKEDRIKILDAGSRDGWVVEFFKSLGYPNVIGIELVFDYVVYCRKMGRNVIVGDLHNICFADNYFDLAFCRHALEHCVDAKKVLEELYRVTKIGGVIYCSFPLESKPQGKHVSNFSRERVFKKFLESLRLKLKIMYLGRSNKVNIIEDGKELLLFAQKVESRHLDEIPHRF